MLALVLAEASIHKPGLNLDVNVGLLYVLIKF